MSYRWTLKTTRLKNKGFSHGIWNVVLTVRTHKEDEGRDDVKDSQLGEGYMINGEMWRG